MQHTIFTDATRCRCVADSSGMGTAASPTLREEILHWTEGFPETCTPGGWPLFGFVWDKNADGVEVNMGSVCVHVVDYRGV